MTDTPVFKTAKRTIDMTNLKTAWSQSKPPDDVLSVIKSMVARAAGSPTMMAPGIARRVLDELNFEGQRRRKEMRVRKHLDRLRAGTWISAFPITFAKLKDGRMWVVDGQHRLECISAWDSAVPVRIDIVDIEGEDEARRLYAGFDEPDSSRNTSELLDAIGTAKAIGIKRETTSALFNAMVILLNGMEPLRGAVPLDILVNPRSRDARLEEMLAYANEAIAYEKMLTRAPTGLRRKLLVAGCFAVAIYTLRHQPTRGAEFWSAVAENDGLKKGDPRATLITDMVMNRLLNNGSVRQAVQQPAVAWNAWNEGRTLKIIKCVSGASITLWGTPLAKGQASE